MPYTKLHIREGFYTEDTRVDSSGRWINGDHIRFVTDVPEKIGGWQKYNNNTFLGLCRSIIYWPTFEDNRIYGFGTDRKLYSIFNGSYWDITPFETGGILRNPFTTNLGSPTSVNVFQANHGLNNNDLVFFQNVTPFAGVTINGNYAITVVDANNYTITVLTPATSVATGGGLIVLYAIYYTVSNPFTTINTQSVVNVTQNNHGRLVGDYIIFQNSSIVGGLNLNNTWYVVNAIIDNNNYTFDAGVAATSSAGPAGGTVNYLYELNPGSQNAGVGLGYGIYTYGYGTYGTPRPNPGVLLNYPRIWSLDIWSDDMIANPRDGGIYYWPHAINTPVTNRAALIPNAPAQSKCVAVWPETSIVISFGCTDTDGDYNPMNVRWSGLNDYTNWALSDLSNFPGQRLLTNGTEIIGIAKMRGQMLIATDSALYSMFINGDDFDFRNLGDVRILSPNAIVEVNGVVYIMGEKQFYIYDGTLRVIRCDVRRHVFEDINLPQGFKVYGALNSAFNEVTWFYPSASYDARGNYQNFENDRYVTYNFQKNIWYFGTMARTAFLDTGEVGIYPIAAGTDNYMYNQEVGLDADGQGMTYFLESGDMLIDERNRFVYVKNIIPDLLESNNNINFNFTSRRFPQDPGYISKNYVITPTTDVIGTRSKGGQVSFTYSNSTENPTGATFQVGSLEVLYLPTGTK